MGWAGGYAARQSDEASTSLRRFRLLTLPCTGLLPPRRAVKREAPMPAFAVSLGGRDGAPRSPGARAALAVVIMSIAVFNGGIDQVAKADTAADAACDARAQTLSEADLLSVMGGRCTDCGNLVAHFNTAVAEYSMACDLRIAAFAAHIRHETADFATFVQPIDNGAGALHMQPRGFRLACREIPLLAAAFQAGFPTCSAASAGISHYPCDCGDDVSASGIVARPEFAFRTAAWWFVLGSEQVLGAACKDLRTAMDVGLGMQQSLYRLSQSPGTGFYKTAACVFGFAPDHGLSQRVAYYMDARRHWESNFVLPPDPSVDCTALSALPTASISSSSLTSALGGSGACGGTCDATTAAYVASALSEAIMSCPRRSAAMIAMARVETDALSSLLDQSTSTAGAIHLSETQLRTCCRYMQSMSDSFAQQFPTCENRTVDPCSCGSPSEVALLSSQGYLAFRVTVWWFMHGATLYSDTGDSCGDLRFDADVGVGREPDSLSPGDTGSGFHKILSCRGGSLATTDRAAAVEYYNAALRTFDPSDDGSGSMTDTDDGSESSSHSGSRGSSSVDSSASGSSNGGGCTCGADQVLVEACDAGAGVSVATCAIAATILSPLSGDAPLHVDLFTPTQGSDDSFRLVMSDDGTDPHCDAMSGVTAYGGRGAHLTFSATTSLRVIACPVGTGIQLEGSPVARIDITVGPSGADEVIQATFKLDGLVVGDMTPEMRHYFRTSVSTVLERPLANIRQKDTPRPGRRLVSSVLVPFEVLVMPEDSPDGIVQAIVASVEDSSMRLALVAAGVLPNGAALTLSSFPVVAENMVEGAQTAREPLTWGKMRGSCNDSLGSGGCWTVMVLCIMVAFICGSGILFALCAATQSRGKIDTSATAPSCQTYCPCCGTDGSRVTPLGELEMGDSRDIGARSTGAARKDGTPHAAPSQSARTSHAESHRGSHRHQSSSIGASQSGSMSRTNGHRGGTRNQFQQKARAMRHVQSFGGQRVGQPRDQFDMPGSRKHHSMRHHRSDGHHAGMQGPTSSHKLRARGIPGGSRRLHGQSSSRSLDLPSRDLQRDGDLAHSRPGRNSLPGGMYAQGLPPGSVPEMIAVPTERTQRADRHHRPARIASTSSREAEMRELVPQLNLGLLSKPTPPRAVVEGASSSNIVLPALPTSAMRGAVNHDMHGRKKLGHVDRLAHQGGATGAGAGADSSHTPAQARPSLTIESLTESALVDGTDAATPLTDGNPRSVGDR